MDDIRERLKKLKDLRKQASHANFKEVLEENERSKRPQNWEKKLERNMKKLEAEEERQKIEDSGQDYELKKTLDVQADELERWERLKANKRRPDPGFIDFEAATKRQYERLVKQLKPEVVNEQLSIEGGPSSSSSAKTSSSEMQKKTCDTKTSKTSSIKDSKDGIERMVEDVHKQIEVRSKRSRRRKHDDEANVDYINERNMRFNKKLERFYGSHTDEIKQNFERGTAM